MTTVSHISRAVVVNLIANTRTEKGLSIEAEIDDSFYSTGIKILDEDMARLAITRDEFHGEGIIESTQDTTHSVQIIFSSLLSYF